MTTKKTTKKTAAKKQGTQMKTDPKMPEPKMPEPMDAGIPEVSGNLPAPALPNARVAYALQTLEAEVEHLFPEVPKEHASVDGRNTALEVVFDTTSLDNEERGVFVTLLDCIEHDPRVKSLTFDAETGGFSLLLHSNARTQDSRDPFNLNEAYLILIEAQNEGARS